MPRHESTWRAPGRGHPGASSASRGSSGGAGARADSSELSSWGWIRGWRERGPNSRSCPEIPVENSPEFRWKTALPPSIFPIFPLFPVFLPRGGGRASWAWDALSRAWISGAIPSLAQTPPWPWGWIPCGCGARERGRSSGSGGSGGFSSLRDSGIPSVELGSRKVFLGETDGALELPNHSRTSAKWDEIHSQKKPPQVIPNPSPGRSHSLGMDLSGKTGVGSVAWWGLEEGRSCGIHPIPGGIHPIPDGIIPGFQLQQEIPGVQIQPGRFGNSWEKAGAGRGSSREAAGAGAVDLPSGRGFPVGIPPALPTSRCSASSQGIFGNVRVRSPLPVPPRPPGFWDGSDSSLLIQEHSVSRKNSSGLSWDSWKNPGTKQSLAKAGR